MKDCVAISRKLHSISYCVHLKEEDLICPQQSKPREGNPRSQASLPKFSDFKKTLPKPLRKGKLFDGAMLGIRF